MPNGRGSSKGWEIRLGAPQVVVWLGLAVGALVGSYFVGFFSGQSVGFESARSASGVEVAKLAIHEELPERSTQNVSAIYDKLTAPALMEESPKAAPEPKAKNGEEQEPAAVRVAKEIKSGDAARNEGTTPRVLGEGDSSGEVDLFEYDSAEATQGGDTAEAPTEESTVRFLGAKADGVTENSDKTLGAILEERLAKARADGSRAGKADADVPLEPAKNEVKEEPKSGAKSDAKADVKAEAKLDTKLDAKPTAKVKSVEESKPVAPALPAVQENVAPPKSDSNFVKRVVPSGYFAQVAAPKNLSDAESVARKLKKSGFPVIVEVANVRGEEYYRVLVGPEQNRVHADRLVDQLRSERYLSGPPFIRQVK
jgi:cell division septation protein DedD